MKTQVVVLRVPPFDPPNAGTAPDFERLAAELGRELGEVVPVVEGRLEDAPSGSFVLHFAGGDARAQLDSLEAPSRKALVPHLVLLKVDRADLASLLTTAPPAPSDACIQTQAA